MRDVAGKYIVIIGAARSGVAAARLLKSKGADVFVSDAGIISDEAKQKLNAAEIPFEENGHSEKARSGDFVVVSPGVPTETELVQMYLNNGKIVVSEIEAASWFSSGKIIAVTGSNGKTTVTSWLSHLWKTAHREHLMAGNIGYAFSESAADQKDDVILEVSSFQLDHIHDFKPNVSALLNITPDHLDRYQGDIQKYAASKYRITENQDSKDTFIYYFDDTRTKAHADSLKQKENAPRIWSFSSQREVPEGAFVRDDTIFFKFNNQVEKLMPVNELSLPGLHNLNNGLATALAARAAEIKNEAIRESLASFEGVEHRLEVVRELNGIRFINDSKATNVNAVWYALESFNVPLTLILGGRDKGNDYSELESQLRDKVHTVIAIGESKNRIKAQLENVVPNFMEADSMAEAVRMAYKNAKRGEIVLLSPACSSFDMFDNYEHRGKVFKEEVNKL